jgi:hypothetical protein
LFRMDWGHGEPLNGFYDVLIVGIVRAK